MNQLQTNQQQRQRPASNDIATNSGRTSAIVETLEHRRFAEFCAACKKYRYIGLCYGSPGVGKTLSARHYANWETVQTYWSHQSQSRPLFKEVSKSSVAFYTAPVVATQGHLHREIDKARQLLHHAAIDRARRYEHVRMIRLLNRAEKLRDRHRNPDGYRGAEADKAENAYLDQRDRAMRVERTVP